MPYRSKVKRLQYAARWRRQYPGYMSTYGKEYYNRKREKRRSLLVLCIISLFKNYRLVRSAFKSAKIYTQESKLFRYWVKTVPCQDIQNQIDRLKKDLSPTAIHTLEITLEI
jgi:hypothetical protein